VTPLLQRILLAVAAAVIGADLVWASLIHFDIDIISYLGLAAVALFLVLGGVYYERARRDFNLSAMLFGTSFLVVFSAGFSLLNYFLLTIAGPRIDDVLAAADRAMGVDWPAIMGFAAAHESFNLALHAAYQSVLPQVAVLVACLGCTGKREAIGPFCLALSIGAAVTAVIWTLFPAFGAFSVYALKPDVAQRLVLALDADYARALVGLLENGPGRISPHDVKGLIGLPSFHLVMAILIVWYARGLKWLRLPAALLNLVVLVATPIQGGHHVVDLIAGLLVATLAILCADRIAGASPRIRSAEDFEMLSLPESLLDSSSAASSRTI